MGSAAPPGTFMKIIFSVSGFASVFILMLVSFLIIFTTITWRSVTYMNQLAREQALFQQAYYDTYTAGLELIALTKNRFDHIMHRLIKTGNNITFSLPMRSQKKTAQALIKRVNPNQLFLELVVSHDHRRIMKCSCKIVQESHQEITGIKITHSVINFVCA